MKDVPGWKTGTWYGEPVYFTLGDKWWDPCHFVSLIAVFIDFSPFLTGWSFFSTFLMRRVNFGFRKHTFTLQDGVRWMIWCGVIGRITMPHYFGTNGYPTLGPSIAIALGERTLRSTLLTGDRTGDAVPNCGQFFPYLLTGNTCLQRLIESKYFRVLFFFFPEAADMFCAVLESFCHIHIRSHNSMV